MEWIDRNLQREILQDLSKIYPNKKTIGFCLDKPEIFQVIGIAPENPLNEECEEIYKRSANIIYLSEHGLITCKKQTMLHATIGITAAGIDFLQQDGGFSAILGVVTVKLHSDTIQELLAAKIDQADITEAEKGRLKTELGKIKDAALGKLTENAIDALPAASLVTLLKTTLGL